VTFAGQIKEPGNQATGFSVLSQAGIIAFEKLSQCESRILVQSPFKFRGVLNLVLDRKLKNLEVGFI